MSKKYSSGIDTTKLRQMNSSVLDPSIATMIHGQGGAYHGITTSVWLKMKEMVCTVCCQN